MASTRTYTLPATAGPQDPDETWARVCEQHGLELLEDPFNAKHDTWCPGGKDGPHPVTRWGTRNRVTGDRGGTGNSTAFTPKRNR